VEAHYFIASPSSADLMTSKAPFCRRPSLPASSSLDCKARRWATAEAAFRCVCAAQRQCVHSSSYHPVSVHDDLAAIASAPHRTQHTTSHTSILPHG
jgi:hypothetical protein